MIFGHFLTEVNEANAFILGCSFAREALLVDVPVWDDRFDVFLRKHGLTLTTVFITHDHFDHTGGLAQLRQKSSVQFYAGKSSVDGITVEKVSHGDCLRVGELSGTVLATPGHTPDSISVAFPGLVFTGDALFSGSVGGTNSAAQAERQIDHLRRHVLTLPDSTQVHTGHGPSSSVGIERRFNPFLQGADRSK